MYRLMSFYFNLTAIRWVIEIRQRPENIVCCYVDYENEQFKGALRFFVRGYVSAVWSLCFWRLRSTHFLLDLLFLSVLFQLYLCVTKVCTAVFCCCKNAPSVVALTNWMVPLKCEEHLMHNNVPFVYILILDNMTLHLGPQKRAVWSQYQLF